MNRATTNPKVAIITRTKNRVQLLERAVESVLKQTRSDWVHVVVNDGGSSTELEDFFVPFEGRYRGRLILVHNQESLTMEAASNVGLASCDSEFVCIHDDDDSWASTFLERTLGHFDVHRADEQLGAVVTWAQVIDEHVRDDGVIETRGSHIFRPYSHIPLFEMLSRNLFPPIAMIIRRASLEAVGPFDATLPVLGDWEFNRRLMLKFRVDVLPEALANYHHRASATGDLSNSVYGGSAKHLFYNDDLLDKILRKHLQDDEGMATLVVMSKIFYEIRDMESRLDQKLASARADILWEIKNHLNWLHGRS